MVISWILNVISGDISDSILHDSSAYDVWNDLRDRFSQSHAPCIFELTRSIATHRQDGSTIIQYYIKLKAFWDELSSISSLPTCTCGASKSAFAFEHQQRLMQFLMGLNESYSSIRSQILIMDSLPSVNRAYNLLLQEERQLQLHVQPTSMIETTALSTRGPILPSPPVAPHSRPPQPGSCTHSHRTNHTIKNCWLITGFPKRRNYRPQQPGPNRGTPQQQQGRPFPWSNVASLPLSSGTSSSSNVPPQFLHSASSSRPTGTAPPFTFDEYGKLLSLITPGTNSPASVHLTVSFSHTICRIFLVKMALFSNIAVWAHHNRMTSWNISTYTFLTLLVLYISKLIFHLNSGVTVLTATYLINRIPTPLLGNRSPYEMLFHSKPNYSHLRVFGCICYAYNIHHKDKFDSRTKPGIFVGFPFAQKGYRIFDIESGKIYTSRDVRFFENIFPYANADPAATNPNRVIPLPILDHESSPPPNLPTPASPTNSSPTPNPPSPTNSSSASTTQNPTPPSATIDTSPSPPPRRSTRTHHPPSYLQDFHCTILPSSTPLSSSMAGAAAAKIPEWRDAMANEIQALEDNHTWTITALPPGKRPIGCKWIYKDKYKADGSVERYKARLVTKGYTQMEGLDYHETFAPVAKLVTVLYWSLLQPKTGKFNNLMYTMLSCMGIYMKKCS
ncbi:uncharacterized protein LOC143883135 [Tasmannia lanceolata]|uniref:uncharacterized protein LOC143883135 n=1 Tax=Tasmannia lanceolata TaxID=3420 RepID=UPI004062F5DA